MAIRTRVERVTVHQEVIASLFKPGGDIWKFMTKAAVYHLMIAQGEAPKRTGHMVESISRTVRPAFNKYETMYTLEVHAPYAKYTLTGTRDRITSNRGMVAVNNPNDLTGFRAATMVVRPTPYSWYEFPTYRTSVRGQVGNDWLGEATRIMLIKMGLI